MGLKRRFCIESIGMMKAIEGLVILGLIFGATCLTTYAQTAGLNFANAVDYSSGGVHAQAMAVPSSKNPFCHPPPDICLSAHQ